MTKEQKIRVEIISQLQSLANQLWDTGQNPYGRKLDKIVNQILEILNENY